ncbi:replication protein [Marinobacter sp. 1Y8]
MGKIIPFNPEHDMDEPTLDDGYCRVVNALAEGLASHPLTATQQRVVWAVIRATYGWQKSKGIVTGSLLANITGIQRQRCAATVSELLEAGVLNRMGGSRSALKINTKTSAWSFPKKTVKGGINDRVSGTSYFSSVNGSSGHSVNGSSVQEKDKRHTDKNPSDSTSDKSSSKKRAPKIIEGAAIQNPSGAQHGFAVDVELSEMMARVIDDRLGQDAPANRNMTTWANQIRLIREQDNRTPEMISALFAFAMADEFWCGNIESPGALRRNWTKLAMKRKAKRDQEVSHAARSETGKPGSELDKHLSDPRYAVDNWD